MTPHLSQKQLIGYVYQTLADGERETIDRHLATCPECRARLAEREAIQRRIRYSVLAWQRQITPPAQVDFGAIAPRVKRLRRLMMFAKRSNLILSSAATIIVLIVAGIGVYSLLNNQPQPVPVPKEEVIEQPAVKATEEINQPVEPAPEDSQPAIELIPGESSPSPGQLKWQITVDGQVASNPTIAAGVVYFGTNTGRIYAVDQQSGQHLWATEIGGAIQAEFDLAVAGGMVYPASVDKHIYAVDSRTGQVVWQFDAANLHNSATAGAGAVYVGSTNLYAVDPQSGRQLWQFDTDGLVKPPPVVAGGMVYVENTKGYLYAIEAQSGQQLWQFNAEDGVRWGELSEVVDGVIYAGTDSYLFAVDTKTGQAKWRFDAARQPVAAAANGMVYVGSSSGQVYALASESGQELWQFKTGAQVVVAPAIADGVVYVSSDDHQLYALDGQTGQVLWQFAAADVMERPVVADGVVYVGDFAGHLYAIWAGAAKVGAIEQPATDHSSGAMFRGNPQHTGVFEAQGPAQGELQWKFETEGDILSTPIIEDNVVYFGSNDHHLYALNSQTGQELWRFDMGGWVMTPPAITDGVVYAGSGCAGDLICIDGANQKNQLLALDSQTGQEIWHFSVEMGVWSSPVIVDGVVYFGSYDGHLYAVNSQTGQEIWRFKADNSITSSPAVVGDTIYFGSGCFQCTLFSTEKSGDFLYAVDRQTGQELWRFKTEGYVESSVTVVDGVVYFGSNDRYLYAVDSHSGQMKWQLKTFGRITSSPAVTDERVYITSHDRNLYAVDRHTGQEIWRFTTDWPISSSPVVAAGVVYFGGSGSNGPLYAIDNQTGQELWKFKTDEPIYASPTVANGMVYFGSEDNHLYAIK